MPEKRRDDDARDESKTAAQIEDAVVRLEILGIGLRTGLRFSCNRGFRRASIPGRSQNRFRPEGREELYDYGAARTGPGESDESISEA